MTHIVSPQTYGGVLHLVGTNETITCRKKIEADVRLRIRHGPRLLLRNFVWRVSDEPTDIAIIGLPLLESIECSDNKLLEAAADNNECIIDASKLQKEHGASKVRPKIKSLLEEAICHSAGWLDDDELGDDDVYIDMGDNPDEELVSELEKKLTKQRKMDYPKKGTVELRRILFKYNPIFDQGWENPPQPRCLRCKLRLTSKSTW